jgi:hypothetical protein
MVDRGSIQFSLKFKRLREAGAVAVVLVNNRAPDHADGWFPFGAGVGADGYQDIPTVMIGKPDGDKIKTALGSDIQASISPDLTVPLGVFEGGRGAADTLFGILVPQAGLYPFRCLWYEGGGGANIEWFSLNATGGRVLLNDTANGGLKTYRQRTFAARPTIAISVDGANAVITFTGVLQGSDNVEGGYADVAGATSPRSVPLSSAAKKFYRARGQ